MCVVRMIVMRFLIGLGHHHINSAQLDRQLSIHELAG